MVPPCPLGRCHNPLCPRCFPLLSLTAATATTKPAKKGPAWQGATITTSSSSSSSLSSSSSRSRNKGATNDNLVELIVVQCTAAGEEFHALQTIWCPRSATLHDLRIVLETEIATLRQASAFHFVRIVAGHVVHVTPQQEVGPKAYSVAAFVPPLAPTPRVLVCMDDEPKKSKPRHSKKKRNDNNKQQHGEFPTIATEIANDTLKETLQLQVLLEMEGQTNKDDDAINLGMIQVPSRSVSLGTVRKAITNQLPAPPRGDYRLLRPTSRSSLSQQRDKNEKRPTTTTVLSKAQEEQGYLCLDHILNKPKHAAGALPRIMIQTRKSYTEGQVIADETKTRELKSLAAALWPEKQAQQPKSGGKSTPTKSYSPRQMVVNKAAKYINAFLNSVGGVLIFGANDDGVIERVPIYGNTVVNANDLDAQVALARYVKDDIRKLVDGILGNMDPSVDGDLVTTTFVPVLPASGSVDDREEEIYNVIEINVQRGRRSLYFIDKHKCDAFERRDGSTHCMDRPSMLAALRRLRPGEDPDWQGGWRQLSSPFDFDPLMRRLSDPWAGREWLFAAVRQSLFATSVTATASRETFGVALVGSRGMGKTSFLSEFALRPETVTQLKVVAHHLCRPDDPDTLNPALFVQSLAAMLAENFKEYQLLMINNKSSTTATRDGDTIGASMLRALRKEQCESNPDDSFLRGILRPLQEIEARKPPDQKEGYKFPMVVIVDAIDDALGVDLESSTTRRGSSTIAHLLERGLGSVGLPPWIKFVVSFRRDMCQIAGPIQRLAQNLNLINLDQNPSGEIWERYAQEDIRLFVEAFIERQKMKSPLGSYVGRGKWNPASASRATTKLRLEKGEKIRRWEYEAMTREWAAFGEFATIDLNYCLDVGLDECLVAQGKHIFLVKLSQNTMQDAKKKCKPIRYVEVNSADNAEADEDKRPKNVPEGPLRCARCKEAGHFARHCPIVEQETQELQRLVQEETKILGKFASNAQGNYLYARTVLEDIRSGAMEWKEVPSLPSGLDHLYHRFFCTHFGGRATADSVEQDEDLEQTPRFRTVKPVLEVLLAATKRGVTEQNISHAVVAGGACDPAAVNYCLRDIQWALDADISGPVPRYSLRHESIRGYAWQSSIKSILIPLLSIHSQYEDFICHSIPAAFCGTKNEEYLRLRQRPAHPTPPEGQESDRQMPLCYCDGPQGYSVDQWDTAHVE